MVGYTGLGIRERRRWGREREREREERDRERDREREREERRAHSLIYFFMYSTSVSKESIPCQYSSECRRCSSDQSRPQTPKIHGAYILGGNS